MSLIDTDTDPEVRTTPDADIDVSEIWPGRFALTIETGGGGVSTTTTHDLDADQLRALGDRIDAALADAH